MTWWAVALLWLVAAVAAVAAHAALCYARDLREEREDRMRKAVALRNRLADFRMAMAELSDQDPGREPWLEELDGIMVEAVRTGVPFDAEAAR
jgi:hypothetical protein